MHVYILFEMKGIYRHALRVCKIMRINLLLEKFILNLWRKNFRKEIHIGQE